MTEKTKNNVVNLRDEDDYESQHDRYVSSWNKSLGLDFNDITGSDDLSTGLWDQEVKAFIEASTLKGLFFHEDWVFIILDLVADMLSSSPLRVFKSEIRSDKEIVSRDDDHPVNGLLENPNDFQDGESWMYVYTVEYLLMGNVIQWRAPRTNQLMILPADTVMLDFNEKGILSGYVISSMGNAFALGGKSLEGMKFPLNQIWHQRRPNPASLLWGLSPFIPNRKSILFNRYSSDYLNQFYLKGATPHLALKMEKNVSEDSAMRFLRTFEIAHTGRRNMRRPMMLPKGVDVQELSHKLADQGIVDLVNMNLEKIINTLKVPKHALSLAKTGSLGSEEHKSALKFMWKSAIIPNQGKIARFLTRQFQDAGMLEPDRFLDFDNSNVESLKDDLIKKAELGEKLISSGQQTPNEVRSELWDKAPLAGGDRLMIAQSSAAEVSQPPPPPDISDGLDDTDQDEDLQEEEEKSLEEWVDPEEKAIISRRMEKVYTKYGDLLDSSQKGMDDELEKKIPDYISLNLELLADQAEMSVKIAKKQLEKVPKREGKKSEAKADSDRPSKVPSLRTLRRLLREAFGELEEAYKESAASQLGSTVEAGYDSQMKFVFNQDALDTIQTLRQRDGDKRRKILEARQIETFKNLSSTSTDKVLNEIRKGVQEKESIQQIARRISDNFKSVSPGRAETIARTEVLTAVSIGKQAALENAEEVLGKMFKLWISARDSRVRDSHQEVDTGKAIPSDKPFENGLMYPRDVMGPVEETINCRCDFLMLPEKDIGDIEV